MTEHERRQLSTVADELDALQRRLDGIADDLAALRQRISS